MPPDQTFAIVRTDRLGDMVLTLPMVAAIHRVNPNARVVVICRRYVAPLVEGAEGIDDVRYVDDSSLYEILREVQPSTVFFPRPTFSDVLAAVRARVRYRVGTSRRWYSWFLTHRDRQSRSAARKNEAEYNVDLVRLRFGDEAAERLMGPLHLLAPPPVPPCSLRPAGEYVVLHPGSGGSARTWPVSLFAELAQRLYHKNIDVVVTGSDGEQDLVRIIERQTTIVNLCGRTTLTETIDILRHARCVVANSTGVLHVAAACGSNVVGLYPASPPSMSARRWGPWTDKATILEADDMASISVDDVVSAITAF